jgi:preprotein translocase subunit Sec63
VGIFYGEKLMIKKLKEDYEYKLNNKEYSINIIKHILSLKSVRVSLLLIVLSFFIYDSYRVQLKLKENFLEFSNSCNLSGVNEKQEVDINISDDYRTLISLYNKRYIDNLEILKRENSEICLLDIYNSYLRKIDSKINECYMKYGIKCSLKTVELISLEEFLKMPSFSIYKIKYYAGLKRKYNKLKGSM